VDSNNLRNEPAFRDPNTSFKDFERVYFGSDLNSLFESQPSATVQNVFYKLLVLNKVAELAVRREEVPDSVFRW
jgi:hypothetical protein